MWSLTGLGVNMLKRTLDVLDATGDILRPCLFLAFLLTSAGFFG